MNKQKTGQLTNNAGRSLLGAVSLVCLFVAPRIEAQTTYTWTATTARYWQNAFWSPSAGTNGPGAGDTIGATTGVGTLRMDANFSLNYNIANFLRTGSGAWILESIDNGRTATDPIRNVTLNISGSLQTDSSAAVIFRSNTFNDNTKATLAIKVGGNLWTRAGNIFLGTAETPFTSFNSALSELTITGTTSINANRILSLYVEPGKTQLGRVTANGVFQIHLAGHNDVEGLVKIRALGGSGTVMVSDYAALGDVKATLDINGNLNGAFLGLITNGTASNVLSVIKSGTGIQVFNGANDYSGGTVASGGLLLAQNTTGSAFGYGAVAVTSTGILGGNGIIAPEAGNDITVDGTLRPGYYEVQQVFEPGEFLAGTLNIDFSGDSKLVFNPDSILDLMLGIDSSSINFVTVGDWLEGSGNVTLNLTLGAGFDYANSYTIFSGVTTTGFTFADVIGIDPSYEWSIDHIGNDYVLSFHQAIPEPSTIILSAIGVSFLLYRRFRRQALSTH